MASNPHVMECPHGQCTTTTHTKTPPPFKNGFVLGLFLFVLRLRSFSKVGRVFCENGDGNCRHEHVATLRCHAKNNNSKKKIFKKKRKRMGKLLGIDTKQMHSLYSSYHENWQPMSFNLCFCKEIKKTRQQKTGPKGKEEKNTYRSVARAPAFPPVVGGAQKRTTRFTFLFKREEYGVNKKKKNHVFFYYLTCILICQIGFNPRGFENERSEGCSTFPRPPEEQLYIYICLFYLFLVFCEKEIKVAARRTTASDVLSTPLTVDEKP